MSIPCSYLVKSLIQVIVGRERKLNAKTVPSTNTMIDLLPDHSTTLFKTPTPNADAHEAMIIVNHAYWKSTNPSNEYWNVVEHAVNTPMKLEVAVEILGSNPKISKIGPISRPPAIPNDPARIPAS